MAHILYYSPGACSMASHIILKQSGHPFEARCVRISANEHKSEEYLKINPHGRVPTLITPRGPLTETVAILAYLADAFPESRFMPNDPFLHATCLSRLAWFASSVHPTFRIITRTERITDNLSVQTHIKREAREPVWSLLKDIDRALAHKEWVAGEQYTVCDPYALVFYASGIATGFPMENLPDFTRHTRKLCVMPAVRSVLEVEASPLLDRF